MKFDLEKLQGNYVETKAGASIDPDKLNSHIKEIYGQEPQNGDSEDVRNQVDILCNKMEAIGLNSFGKLREKFKPDNNLKKEGLDMRIQIKKTMEAIVYQAETGNLAPKDIAAQFGDLDFICKEGTLTNLQSILGEMTLGKQDISAFVTEAKNEMVTQLITEMYRDNKFYEYPYAFRKYESMEIHNITSLKNTVANEYGLLTKTKDEDRYIENISDISKQKIQGALIERMTSPEAAETLIDRVAMNVLMNLPYYEEGMNKTNFVNNFMDKLEVLGIKGELVNGAFIKYQKYVADGAKDNIQDIIKDAIIVKLHKDNAIESKDIDKVKLRLSLENSMDVMSSRNAIGEEVIKQAKENKLESYAFEYAIDKGLKVDSLPPEGGSSSLRLEAD